MDGYCCCVRQDEPDVSVLIVGQAYLIDMPTTNCCSYIIVCAEDRDIAVDADPRIITVSCE